MQQNLDTALKGGHTIHRQCHGHLSIFTFCHRVRGGIFIFSARLNSPTS
jgi:hypothetical protein